MTSPVAEHHGHRLDLTAMVCSCGEWSYDAADRRLGFEMWRVHAESGQVLTVPGEPATVDPEPVVRGRTRVCDGPCGRTIPVPPWWRRLGSRGWYCADCWRTWGYRWWRPRHF